MNTNEVEVPMGEGPLRVLHVSPSFYPAMMYGGPIFSTKAMCDGVTEDKAIELRVLTTDAAGPLPSHRVVQMSNPALFPSGYSVQYCHRIAMASISPELIFRLPQLIKWANVVHLTGTYSFPTLPTLALCRVLGRPLVWSPRGGLHATAQWAGAPRRRIKRMFEHLCHILRPQRVVLHVTSDMERHTSRKRLKDIATVVIPNIVEVPSSLPIRNWRPNGQLRIMFISRLHAIKGLDILIDALAHLPEHVTLHIFGAGDATYEASLRRRVQDRKLGSRISFNGHVEGEAKQRAFLEADLFCLPTRSENFGVVIGEALAHGLPVITTTAAPWERLEDEGCGLWIEQGLEPLVRAIRAMEVADLPAMGKRGRNWMARDFSREMMTRRTVELYRRLSEASS
jgi:glycosyltransferase involved in cell wall biosynthesis